MCEIILYPHLALVLLILGSINEFSDARASFRTGFYPKNQRTAGEKNGIKGTPKQSRGISALLFFLAKTESYWRLPPSSTFVPIPPAMAFL